MSAVKVIVVTGGIASGKSTVVGLLQEAGGKGTALFDCDAEVAKLLCEDGIKQKIAELFGDRALSGQGEVDKGFLRSLILKDPEARASLEGILHPELADMCRQAQQEAEKRGDIHTFIIDIPLYYESPASFPGDKVCVVASTPGTQIARLMARSSLTEDEARDYLAAQMPTHEKIERAHTVFWNEGPLDLLRAQVQYFFEAELADEAQEIQAKGVIYDLNEWRMRPLHELQKTAMAVLKKTACAKARSELLLELIRSFLRLGNQVFVEGVLEFSREGQAFLRDPRRSFRPAADDPVVPSELLKRYRLRPGNAVRVRLGQETGGKPSYSLKASDIMEIEGIPAGQYVQKADFERLTPLFPRTRIMLENSVLKFPAMRVLDLITPLGMGQRALIVAPPRGGKTVLLKSMAKSIRANYPHAELLILLLDERPEEVTDFEETVDAPVFASTFDEPSRRHAQLSDLVLERARRLVEQGKDVIIMLDSLTRLARGYNANQSGGRTMSGGLGSNALEKPRKFFGAARNVEEGGSLTIIATCLVDTESRMDEIIFEEFKGTGNMEIRLDRELSERRIYPAISIPQSGTRNDDRLYHPDEFTRILQLRRQLASHPGWEALELLLKNIKRTQNNAELLLSGLHMMK